jgi:adenylate kinase family enzyme
VRVHLLGGTGSGKTTLAKTISARFQIPHYDLDQLGSKYAGQDKDLLGAIIEVAEQPGWVAEGVYLIWTDPLFYRADYIVLLDIPWPIAAWRVIVRHFRRSIHGTNPYPGLDGLRGLVRLVQYARTYAVATLPADSSAVKSLSKFIDEDRLKVDAPDSALLLTRLEEYQGGVAPTMEFVRMYLEKYREKVIHINNNADRDRLLALLTKKFAGSEEE